jgi:hypothetical protein
LYLDTLTTGTTVFASWTAANKAAKWATFTQNTSLQAKTASFKSGYQLVTQDISGTTVANSGHVYGLLGQGDTMIATTTKAF